MVDSFFASMKIVFAGMQFVFVAMLSVFPVIKLKVVAI